MTFLLDRRIDRTLDLLTQRFGHEAFRGARIEAWLFEDLAARRTAEQQLARFGVHARIRSAYKPLVHFFLEEAPDSPSAVTVHAPCHSLGSEQRFRLEAYPLAGLLGVAPLRFGMGSAELAYQARIETAEGSTTHEVFAPNQVKQDHLGQSVLTPTGWLRVWRDGGDGKPDEDGPLETEYEAAFAAAIAAVAAHSWPATSPQFTVLEISVETVGVERRLPWQDECMSTSEGLHEDLYFSLLEFFQRHAGLKLGDRTLQPGQIIPLIRSIDGPTRVRVRLCEALVEAAADVEEGELATARRPLTPRRIKATLDALAGEPLQAKSFQGRTVEGVFLAGNGPGLVVTGGQHANETTGVVGALRAAEQIKQDGYQFAVIPQENPDGYALHRRLRQDNPRQMHHAARYTALGDDLQYRLAPPLYEKAARIEAFRRTGTDLHINLHGYPAHEWNRPLTGYLTRGFEAWSIPKGFYLILRHPPGARAAAVAFVQRLTARLAQVPGLLALNEAQIAAWVAHVGNAPEPIFNGIPCTIVESTDLLVPFTLITEFPDETIYDAAFQLGHTVQMMTVLEAAALHRAGVLAAAA